MADIIIPDFPELTFDEGEHIYRLNGEVIPSVTQVMKPLNQAKYDGISEKTLDNAARRGTTVHNSIENYIKYEFVDCPLEHRPYVEAFVKWWELMHPMVIGSEVRVYHKLLQYGGTIDLVCEISGELWLIDYKTTYAVSKITCGVQLEAYKQALNSHGVRIVHKAILHLQKTGQYKLIEFPAEDPLRWRVFAACKTVGDYLASSEK